MKNLLVLIFFTKTKLFFSAIQLFENNLVCVTQKPFLHNLTWVKWNLIGLMQSSPLVSSPIRFPLGSRKLFAEKYYCNIFEAYSLVQVTICLCLCNVLMNNVSLFDLAFYIHYFIKVYWDWKSILEFYNSGSYFW